MNLQYVLVSSSSISNCCAGKLLWHLATSANCLSSLGFPASVYDDTSSPSGWSNRYLLNRFVWTRVIWREKRRAVRIEVNLFQVQISNHLSNQAQHQKVKIILASYPKGKDTTDTTAKIKPAMKKGCRAIQGLCVLR